MSEQKDDACAHPQRDQTDESLRAERERSDVLATERRVSVQDAADEVVRIARQRADRVVDDERAAADDPGRVDDTGAGTTRRRAKADVLLGYERLTADASLDDERLLERGALLDALLLERDTTDQDLVGERAHADTSLAARDEFLGTVSHDLRSLLASLSVTATLVSRHAPEGPDGDTLRRHAGTSQRIVTRMARLVGDLLDVVSIDAGRLTVVREPVEVVTLVRDTLEAFEPLAAAAQITLVAEPVAPGLHARLDAGRLLQVLGNLVGNALKFTPPEGRITLAVRAEGHELRFSVTDTGIGIAEELLPHVFERFQQARTDRRGHGLGLHIAKCIVEAHGGRMWVESRAGAGSTFTFALPQPPERRLDS